MNKKAIAYTVDNNVECLLQLAQSINSIVKTAPEEYDIYILTDEPKPWMQNLHRSSVVSIAKLVQEYGLNDTGILWRKKPVPPMLMARLLIPLVPELQSYEQILYLDTDTEVWSPEFFGLFNESHTSEVICVRDSLSASGTIARITRLRTSAGPDFKEDANRFSRWSDLISQRATYVNSGVIVFNMPVIRKGYEEKLKFVYGRMKELGVRYPEQDVLNLYYRIHAIEDRRYNAWDRFANKALLRHYVGNERKKEVVYPIITSYRPSLLLDTPGSQGKNEELGVFNGIVDKVYLLTNYENITYFNRINTWLSEHGVTDFKQIHVEYSGNYDNLLNRVSSDPVNPRHLDNWIGHYKAVVDALRSGYTKIAILEDTFDTTNFEDALTHLVPDFDIALCPGTKRFGRSDSFEASSSKGYILGMRGMVALRRLFESLWDTSIPSRRLRYVHRWLNYRVIPKMRALVRG